MGVRLSGAEESKNIEELSRFREYWRDSPEYPSENFGNDRIRYPVNVTYTWGNGQSETTFSSQCYAFVGAGPRDGAIEIDGTEKIRADDFHLGFGPGYQNYVFDQSDKSLVISDKSPKMGGEYQVRIRPNIVEP